MADQTIKINSAKLEVIGSEVILNEEPSSSSSAHTLRSLSVDNQVWNIGNSNNNTLGSESIVENFTTSDWKNPRGGSSSITEQNGCVIPTTFTLASLPINSVIRVYVACKRISNSIVYGHIFTMVVPDNVNCTQSSDHWIAFSTSFNYTVECWMDTSLNQIGLYSSNNSSSTISISSKYIYRVEVL